MRVYVSAHVYMFMTFHNGFMFLLQLTYVYMLSRIVTEATTFEMELCGNKQATAQAHVRPHGV